jgi:spore maturation protein CgeB
VKIVILGLSVTSSWGNGHATTYRSLIHGLAARGHQILFLERDVPWYAGNRDQPYMRDAGIELYFGLEDLASRFERSVRTADLVIVGSFVPEGAAVGRWAISTARGVTAFYDIDTPVTLAKLESGDHDYLSPDLVSQYDLYLSFTGGPTPRHIERRYGSPMARVLYCSVLPQIYCPEKRPYRWDLGYLGTYSSDRQPVLERLLLEPAREWRRGRFNVTGPLYPDTIRWPRNVTRTVHLEPPLHRAFYASQRFTLNVTRELMVEAGYAPSVRLFEAGACGVPVVSDYWEGLETLFEPGKEILIAESAEDTLRYLRDLPEQKGRTIGARARARVMAEHTPERRAAQLESYFQEARANRQDYVLTASTRANGNRKYPRRTAAGGAAGATPGEIPSNGSLKQQPSGAGQGTGRPPRPAAPAARERCG